MAASLWSVAVGGWQGLGSGESLGPHSESVPFLGVMAGVSSVWAGSRNKDMVLPHAEPPVAPPYCHSHGAEPQMVPLLIPPPIMNCNNNPITLCSPIG